MIADLKPYPEYRIAEGGWIGEIPAHWQVRRMKYVVREVDSRSKTGKEQLLRVSQYTGVTQRHRDDGLEEPDTRADSLIGYKRVESNDLVINIMLAWNGSMGVSRYEGIVSPAYCVYRFGSDLHPWYFHNLLRSPSYKARIKASSTGVVESRLRLYSDDLGRIEAMVPPPDEQVAIVRFLDWANGRLERVIRAKRKVITLLNEQKQVTIHRAVTRGLDPSVPLKASGVPWLGDIPEHWEVRQLRHLGHLNKGVGGSKEDATSEGVPCVRYGELYFHYRNSILEPRGFVSAEKAAIYTPIYFGDVLFAASGERIDEIGKSAVNLYDGKAVCGGDIVIFRPTAVMCASFLGYALDSFSAAYQKASMCRGTTIKHIYPDELRGLWACVPPAPEQEQIAASLDHALRGCNTTISRLEREIELLREYRTRLVADVVTGKLDVREAAARLPDEAPLDSVEDEAEPDDEAEAADEEAAA